MIEVITEFADEEVTVDGVVWQGLDLKSTRNMIRHSNYGHFNTY